MHVIFKGTSIGITADLSAEVTETRRNGMISSKTKKIIIIIITINLKFYIQ